MPPRSPPLPGPLLVRKKLVPADCADAGGAATTASAKQAAEASLTNARMEFLPIVLVTLQPDQPGANAIIPFHNAKATRTKQKRRGKPRRFASVLIRRSAGLLDRGKFPVPAAMADEGPDLGDLGRLIAAGDHLAVVAIESLVDQREAHRDRRIIGIALAPGFRKVALQQLDARDLVDGVTRLVVGEVAGEIGH